MWNYFEKKKGKKELQKYKSQYPNYMFHNYIGTLLIICNLTFQQQSPLELIIVIGNKEEEDIELQPKLRRVLRNIYMAKQFDIPYDGKINIDDNGNVIIDRTDGIQKIISFEDSTNCLFRNDKQGAFEIIKGGTENWDAPKAQEKLNENNSTANF